MRLGMLATNNRYFTNFSQTELPEMVNIGETRDYTAGRFKTNASKIINQIEGKIDEKIFSCRCNRTLD